MIIQYCSDLHLEFRENREFLEDHPIQPGGDILILAGDTVPFSKMDAHRDFFDYLSGHFKFTYWIPGNHEYYHSDAAQRSGTFKEKIRDNIVLLNNTSIRHGDVKLIFSTLWSRISPHNARGIEGGMSDFRVIQFNGHRFSPSNFNQFHLDSLACLKQELADCHDCKTVVVSHHVPTFLNYPAKYLGDKLNEAFAVELAPLIESSSIDYWIYGHHHSPIPDYSIGNTGMRTNQLGYVRYDEHRNFDNSKTLIL